MLSKQKKVFAVPCDPAGMQKAARMQKDFYLAWGVGPTHSGSSDEVGEIPCAPMQNGFLDPFHVQEQSGVHGSGCREMSSWAQIIC